ncbi:MAG TPA: hypothetical protein VK627_07670 [Edaphobacter sp.]|jgi:hypothetical protein|nr:hypothetical protein [Edaphobacter sp.]
MKHLQARALFALAVLLPSIARAQANPTATRQLQLSAFAGGTGTFTDLFGGKNLGITAGADLTLLRYRLLRPSIEVRGTYPIHEGKIDSQKSILAGAKVEHSFGPFRPYVDFLVGRGEINYLLGGYYLSTSNTLYIRSTSTVYSPGIGIDYDLTRRLAVKADLQVQRWNTPVLPSGTIHPRALTIAAVYRFR